MDRGAWRATVNGVTKSQTLPSTHASNSSMDLLASVYSLIHSFDFYPVLPSSSISSLAPHVLAHSLFSSQPPSLKAASLYLSPTDLISPSSPPHHLLLPQKPCDPWVPSPSLCFLETDATCTHSCATAGDCQSPSYLIYGLMNNSGPRKQECNN